MTHPHFTKACLVLLAICVLLLIGTIKTFKEARERFRSAKNWRKRDSCSPDAYKDAERGFREHVLGIIFFAGISALLISFLIYTSI